MSNELIEQKRRVQRTAVRLGVELHTKKWLVRVHDPLVRQIVRMNKQRFPILGQRLGIDGVPVILGGDVTPSRAQINTRLVHAAISVLHLVGASSGGQGQKLISKTDTKDGMGGIQFQRVLNGFNGIGTHVGISGSVGEEEAIPFNVCGVGFEVVSNAMPNNLVKLCHKRLHSLLLLQRRELQCLGQIVHVGLTPCQSLSNNLKRSSHDIGTLDSNGNGQTHVGISNIVFIATTNGRSGGNVHSALDDAPTAFGAVLLHDGADDHGCLVVVNDGVHDIASGNGDEAITSCLGHGCGLLKKAMTLRNNDFAF